MRNYAKTLILLSILMNATLTFAAPLKPRIVVLTDISTWETDDHESLVRLLAHADMFEIEGIIVSTGYSIKTLTKSPENEFINIAYGVIDAYERDLPNLMKRSEQAGHKYDNAIQNVGYWPSAKYFRDRTMFGSLNRGVKFIGDTNDSPGSDYIIKLASEDDRRPIWVTVWGGGNTIAQSIYRVKKDKSTKQVKDFLHKIRVYAITDQDRHYKGEGLDVSSHWWIREQAGKDLIFIWDECAWKAHNGTGKSNWEQYAVHIQGHGNMGSQYPKYKYGVEGDTPAFLYLMPNGLNNPDDPTQCSWGGTYKGDDNSLWQASGSCKEYFNRFYPAAFNNFAARMDWAKDGKGNRNPVIIFGSDKGIGVQTKTPMPGEIVSLDVSNSNDPDGDNLKYKWWVQYDAGAYQGEIDIANKNSSVAKVKVPADSGGKSFHIICEVTDDGVHNLSSYRRVIFEPTVQDGAKAEQRMPKANLHFRQWLFEYIPSVYSNAKMTDHGHWLQAHIGEDLVVSWTQWNEQGVNLKYLESHALTNGKTIFIEKRDKTNWDSHSAVTYINDAGYYISGYDSASMSSWKVEGCNIIQFDGDARMFVEKMGKAWAEAHSFKWWLFRNIPTMYPNAQMIDHTYWLQGRISDQQSVNWTEWTDADSTLKAMEAHNLTPGKSMFIEQKGQMKEWANHPAVTWFKGSGYYISGYDPATMGSWDGRGLTVIQFDGDCEELAQTIALAWVRKNSFENWLYQFIPIQYPNASMSIHFNKWMQAHITDHIVASWEQWNVKGITLKEIEPESLTQGKAFFIEQKGPKKEQWANHPAVTHYEGAGYYCSGYDQATMRTWGIAGLTVIQFDGDCEELTQTIAEAWKSTTKPTNSACCPIEAVACSGTKEIAFDGKLKVSTVKLDGINTFKVETSMGVFHWECDQGKSGWMSAFDNNGKDWISAGPKQRGVGVNSQFRGLPNSGADDWGHPSRNWGHKKANVTSKIVGATEGDKIVIESEGNTIKARWHCFNTHIAMEVVELKSGKYHFLWEGTPGGTIHTKEGIITADGKKRQIKKGWFAETPDWPAGKNGEWFIITDPNKKFNMWMAQTPATNDKGELWYQNGNMDLASFGRPDNKPTFTDTKRKFAWGFIPYAWDFKTAQNHIETILENPLQKKKQVTSTPSTSTKHRVIMMSDFPPINVVKGGNVPNNQKSDPDDMQSIVRFLLYSNEFDVEGLVCAAGTFAMEAHKKHMFDVLDKYEMVYNNLKSHDPAYPTPDFLRSVTYEGLGNNHGLKIQWGKNNQPWSDIIGEGLDSEASNAIIAAADKPDPRPLWIGVWGGAREASQAIWRVRKDRSEQEFKKFISKLRIFLIYYQDATHGWLMNEFPDLFIIDSRKTYQGMFGGRDSLSNLDWINKNIRNDHGPLCSIYPHEGMGCTGVCEGDSPTFMYLVSANRGINNPDDPTQPSWGGQYKRKPGTNHYVDGPGTSSISKWRKDYQEEFKKRADWCVE